MSRSASRYARLAGIMPLPPIMGSMMMPASSSAWVSMVLSEVSVSL